MIDLFVKLCFSICTVMERGNQIINKRLLSYIITFHFKMSDSATFCCPPGEPHSPTRDSFTGGSVVVVAENHSVPVTSHST